MGEPNIRYVTVRGADDPVTGPEFHLECRFDDEQKFAAVIVDGDFERLAQRICDFLNAEAGVTPAARPAEDEASDLERERDLLISALGCFLKSRASASDAVAAFECEAQAAAFEEAATIVETHDIAIGRAASRLVAAAIRGYAAERRGTR